MADAPSTRKLAVVVIGGSAGALHVVERIVAALPARGSVPVVVVLHVGAGAPAPVRALRDGHAARVVEATDKVALEPGTVYLAPAGYHLLVERNGTLALSVDEPVHYSRPSIDVLFESASAAFGSRVLAIVLSGASPDGAAGLRRVREAGGVAVVQTPEDAEAQTMPRAAIDTAAPDVVMTASQIADYVGAVARGDA